MLASQGLVTAAGCCDRDAVEIRVSLARLDDARSGHLTLGGAKKSLSWSLAEASLGMDEIE